MRARLFSCIACLLLAASVTQGQDDGDFSITIDGFGEGTKTGGVTNYDISDISEATVEEVPASSLAMYEKREQLIIPELKLENVTLAEACQQLSALTATLDPDKHGLVIQINTDGVARSSKAKDLAGKSEEATPEGSGDSRRFSLHLTQIPLMTALRYVELKAGAAVPLRVGPTKIWRESLGLDFCHANIGEIQYLTGAIKELNGETLGAALETLGIPAPDGSSYQIHDHLFRGVDKHGFIEIIMTNTSANLARFERLQDAMYDPGSLLLADTRLIHVTDQAFLDSRALKALTWADVAALPEASRPVIFHSVARCAFGETIHAEDSQAQSVDGKRQLVAQSLTLTGTRCARAHIHADLKWSLSIQPVANAIDSTVATNAAAAPRVELAAEFALVSNDTGEFLLAVDTPLKDGKPDGQYLLVVSLRRVRLDKKPLPSLDRLLKAFLDESAPEISP